jgi:hypothetical protein
MTFFSSSQTETDKTAVTSTKPTATAEGVSGTPITTACSDSNCKTVSPGTIVGSIVGGLLILVAGIVGLTFILRRPMPNRSLPMPPQVGVMDETKYVPNSAAPFAGTLPAVQQQQPMTDSRQLPN